MRHDNNQQTPINEINLNEKNQGTWYEYSKTSSLNRPFIKRVISKIENWGTPHLCQHNNHSYHLNTSQARLVSSTTYGGPGSKYKSINEDSCFFGVSRQESLIAGVIDGAGGSKHGYLGGSLANQSLSCELQKGTDIRLAFEFADAEVFLNARGGYATGVSIEIKPDLEVMIGAKGDARALTIRNGKTLHQGTTLIQSEVARRIESGDMPAHAIHTSKFKNIIYSMIGDLKLPLYDTTFKGVPGDVIILASDGLWDVVSDYEIQTLAGLYNSAKLHQSLKSMSYQRNNSKTPFAIQFSPNESYMMEPLHQIGFKMRGDNITIQVIELK